MKNELMKFVSEEFGEVRGIMINNEPYLVGNDVTKQLGYSDYSKAIRVHIDDDDKIMLDKKLTDEMALSFNYKELGQRGGWMINEAGFYSLVFGSELPSAKKFKKWVTSNVLPSIRKHGIYATPTQIVNMLKEPDTVVDVLTVLKEEQDKNKQLLSEKNKIQEEKEVLEEITEQLQKEISEIKPIVNQYNDFMNSNGTTSMKDTAKLLHTGRNQLMEFLRDMKVLNQDNSPSSTCVKNNYFSVKCYVVKTKDDKKYTVAVSRTTNKGKDFLYKFLRKHTDLYSKYDVLFKERLQEVSVNV